MVVFPYIIGFQRLNYATIWFSDNKKRGFKTPKVVDRGIVPYTDNQRVTLNYLYSGIILVLFFSCVRVHYLYNASDKSYNSVNCIYAFFVNSEVWIFVVI